MRNINKESYILWNVEKNCPAERLDMVYHHTFVVQLYNNGSSLTQDRMNPFTHQLVCVAHLPVEWQKKVSHAVQTTIGFPFKEGETYYTIENGQVIESVWDDVAEEIYCESVQEYFSTKEEAEEAVAFDERFDNQLFH